MGTIVIEAGAFAPGVKQLIKVQTVESSTPKGVATFSSVPVQTGNHRNRRKQRRTWEHLQLLRRISLGAAFPELYGTVEEVQQRLQTENSLAVDHNLYTVDYRQWHHFQLQLAHKRQDYKEKEPD